MGDAHQFSRLAEELVADLRGVGSGDPEKSRPRATQPLASVIAQLVEKHKIGIESPEDRIRADWPNIVGPANAAYSHAHSIERGKLTVQVSHGVVRNEIFMHRDAILARIRALPGCGEIKSLNLRSG